MIEMMFTGQTSKVGSMRVIHGRVYWVTYQVDLSTGSVCAYIADSIISESWQECLYGSLEKFFENWKRI